MNHNGHMMQFEDIFVLLQCLLVWILKIDGLHIDGQEVSFNKRQANNVYRSVHGVSLKECYQECERKTFCRAVNYRRTTLTCQLVGTDVPTLTDVLERQRGYVYVEKKPSYNLCGGVACPMHQTCNLKTNSCHFEECQSFAIAENGLVRGNAVATGSKLYITCDKHQVVKSGGILYGKLVTECLDTGTWSQVSFTCELVTCKMRLEWNSSASSGLFPFTDPETGKQIQIFCDFNEGYGYTFISKDDFGNISSLSPHYTRLDYVILRHIRSDGGQRQSTVAILPDYSDRYNVTVLLDESTDFSFPQQSVLRPYILIGFVPNSHGSKEHQTHGYMCNDVPVSYNNCDTNNNNYIAVFQGTVAQNRKQVAREDVGYKWVLSAVPVDEHRYLPASFFGLFEVGMGGCGAFFTSDHKAGSNTALGAAVGLRFDV